MSNNKEVVVIDCGSYSIRIGFAGMEQPQIIIRTIMGTPKYKSIMTDVEYMQKENYFSEEAMQLRGVLKMMYPIKNGVIENWKAMELIWDYIFVECLKINPMEYSVILTEPPLNPKSNRERMAEIMFDRFEVPKLNISNQAVLSLFASKYKSGCVVDIGHDVTFIVPIREGKPITSAIKSSEIGGRIITRYFQILFRQCGTIIDSSWEVWFMQDMKEKFSYLAIDCEKELNALKEKDLPKIVYTFPDNEPLNIHPPVVFLAPEVLFDPSILNLSSESLDNLIIQSISETDVHLREEFYKNIILTGGSSLLPGLKERLTKEIQEKIKETYDVNIITPKQRYSAWLGGSMLGSNPKNINWITKEN